MAFLAIDLLVRARQREVTAGVIEGGVLPIRWVVTGRTVGAIFSIMLIILRVAGEAIRRCALIHIVLVTFLAGCLGVFPFQLKGRQVVIELGGFPAIGGVTSPTVRAEAACVRVLRQMAGHTVLSRRLHVRDTACICMAGVAGNIHMLPSQ